MKNTMLALIAAVALAGTAVGQAIELPRSRILADRLFVFQMMSNCPAAATRPTVQPLIDRTRAALLAEVPGARGQGMAEGVQAGMLTALAATLFFGDRPTFCQAIEQLFTRMLTEMASE